MFDEPQVQVIREALAATVDGTLDAWPCDRLERATAAVAAFANTPPDDVAARKLDRHAFAIACCAVRLLNLAVGSRRAVACVATRH